MPLRSLWRHRNCLWQLSLPRLVVPMICTQGLCALRIWNLGPVSISRCRLTSLGIPIIKIRLSWDSLIFIMGIPIPVKRVFLLRQGPALSDSYDLMSHVLLGCFTDIRTIVQVPLSIATGMIIRHKIAVTETLCNAYNHMANKRPLQIHVISFGNCLGWNTCWFTTLHKHRNKRHVKAMR